MIFLLLCLTCFTQYDSRSVHVASDGIASFLFMPEQQCVGYGTTSSLPVPLSVGVSVASVLAAVNSAAMNIGVHLSFRIMFFSNSGIAGSCDKPGRRQWHPTPALLPEKPHGRRSLVGCCPWGREESDTTERLHFPFSLSCIGEGNGNPLQCSCLENPRDRGAWQAAVYGVAQSRTRLK